MPIYVGDGGGNGVPIDDILSTSDADDYDQVYIGSDLVWPPIEFPYSVLNTNITDAAIPEGATGCWVHLWGGAEAGGTGGHDDSTTATGSASGGSGGAGAGCVDKFFIYREDLDSDTWSLITGTRGVSASANGTASRFISGSVDLIANGGVNGVGGTASATGLTAGYYDPKCYNGANKEASSNGGGGGGADGGGASWTGDNTPHTSSPGTRGTGNPQTGQTGDPGDGGTGGNAHGSGAGHHYASGGGGGGGGAYTNGGAGAAGTQNNGGQGGAGGLPRAEVVWVDDHVPKERTWRFAPGAWSWTVPDWAQDGWEVDIIEWAGGKAGANGGSTSAGNGGLAGATNSQTLTLGVELALGGTLSGNVGAGGASNGANGGNTTCTQLGHIVLGATGTTGAQDGANAASVTIGGETYPGGLGGTSGSSSSAGQDGGSPGGGGEGGGSLFFVGLAGGKGGDGRVIIRLREV
ncbi:minor tail protein [Mycobacterium phage Serendipitous]|uniref:Minor tail protein n=1 Tax=Mycobacterium phage Serendipitous TaxID=2301619 RepID=A0A385UFP3_9CAUD|nr:minor tail protein [Mycobacterium phage Serendipitous]AYB70572.1 minor tail protein [Mycobacterium phage Serendipitous]